jgi:hypothetical protein
MAHPTAPPAPRLSRHHAACRAQMGRQVVCCERGRAGAVRGFWGRPVCPSLPPPGLRRAARGREGGVACVCLMCWADMAAP